ncbi:hypothetical protein FSP39_015683 [Pinctada imbricata]|uniref:Uncharacterized protein n=1 Tax=Pinctada imbricata TaxID=66713 RepID=A0AA89BX90_PINIB|nr:hypothetical protein FSP39_015683 [Pinctada imbricata]
MLNNKNVISDQHEESLYKILHGHHSDGEKKVYSETEITIALAEHLLGKLSPGKSYTIDSKVKKKGKCSCGFSHCKSNPAFGGTGIGHEEAWHGFLDIIFHSHGGLPETAAAFVEDNQGSETLTCPFDDGEDESEGDSPGGKTESQVIAQTIVFSFIQRKRHPHFSNFLIPNILISPHDFRIIMYDAFNDILICSVPFQIFHPYPSTSLQTASILILWMVLHYRMFCVGIDTSLIIETAGDLKKIQSNFNERAKNKLELYVNASKCGVQGFPLAPHLPRAVFPSHELLMVGIHLISEKSSGQV